MVYRIHSKSETLHIKGKQEPIGMESFFILIRILIVDHSDLYIQ